MRGHLSARPTMAEDDAASDVSTENFSSGEDVLLDGKIRAKVAYFGQVLFSHDDDWVGLAFEEPVGKHSGTVGGTEYFKCSPLHGLFVRSHRLQRTDHMGHATARVKSPYRLRPATRSPAGSPDLEMEEDIFTKADQTDPLGFYEARAGTVRSPDSVADDISSKFERLIDQSNDDQVNFGSSNRIHSSRTPTPTHKYSTSRKLAPTITRKVTTINKSKPYGITLGYGELDH